MKLDLTPGKRYVLFGYTIEIHSIIDKCKVVYKSYDKCHWNCHIQDIRFLEVFFERGHLSVSDDTATGGEENAKTKERLS